ncbi:MAG: hypothetical protein ACO1NX_01685 [Chitinophagaceae bacterium]
MKKVFLFMAVAATAVLTFSSCEKLKDAIFESFETPYGFEVNVPVVANASSEVVLSETAVRFNLDSIIRANTGNVFGADIVGNVQVRQVSFEVVEGNGSLNNFEYVKMDVSASNGTPITMGPYTIPTTATSSASFAAGSSFNVKSLFSGASVNFKITGKARTAPTQAMKVRVNLLLGFDK